MLNEGLRFAPKNRILKRQFQSNLGNEQTYLSMTENTLHVSTNCE